MGLKLLYLDDFIADQVEGKGFRALLVLGGILFDLEQAGEVERQWLAAKQQLGFDAGYCLKWNDGTGSRQQVLQRVGTTWPAVLAAAQQAIVSSSVNVLVSCILDTRDSEPRGLSARVFQTTALEHILQHLVPVLGSPGDQLLIVVDRPGSASVVTDPTALAMQAYQHQGAGADAPFAAFAQYRSSGCSSPILAFNLPPLAPTTCPVGLLSTVTKTDNHMQMADIVCGFFGSWLKNELGPPGQALFPDETLARSRDGVRPLFTKVFANEGDVPSRRAFGHGIIVFPHGMSYYDTLYSAITST
jgi:hypothetical protein